MKVILTTLEQYLRARFYFSFKAVWRLEKKDDPPTPAECLLYTACYEYQQEKGKEQ